MMQFFALNLTITGI